MPITYVLIASNVLTSTATSVTFSSIPNTYTDLEIRMSVRSSAAAQAGFLYVQPNGDTTTTNYSTSWLQGDGTLASSNRWTTSSGFPGPVIDGVTGATSTTNTFSNIVVYLPSYLSTSTKQISSFAVSENNSSSAVMRANAHLYAGTTAISSLVIANQAGPNFEIGSSFWLYGIKNS